MEASFECVSESTLEIDDDEELMGLQRMTGESDTDGLTPKLLLNEARMLRNIEVMNERLLGHGVAMRPHVKTAKSVPVIERMLAQQPDTRVTVSTLAEADACVSAGMADFLYAVGMVPGKLAAIQSLNRRGGQGAVLIDSIEMAAALSTQLAATRASADDASLRVFVELDVDGHRAGVHPNGPELIQIASALVGSPSLELTGVMTHAGGSYHCRSGAELTAMAERERAGAVLAQERMMQAGLPCPVVSVGSTPTAMFARSFAGVTEVRVGVYVFQDLTMLGLGVCRMDDLALSVLTTVIGHQPKRHCLLVDAGWMALSSDRSTSHQGLDQGFGLVVGGETAGLIVSGANQEHGLISRRDGGPLDVSQYPIGSQLRVLPNHACATAAAHPHYDVQCVDGSTARWPRFGGWT